ncbi:MAG TPA: hypothetical protein VGK93_03055 [Candidatus Eisenbacteria bacterium]|jgi:hypothetical protein
MTDFSFHLAPNAPWIWLILASLLLTALGLWAYRFAVPPLPKLARRALPLLRIASLLALAWLLAQPVLERARAGRGAEVAVLLDRSLSMDLPAKAGAPASRIQLAEGAVEEIQHAWRGHAMVRVVPFAGRLGTDSSWTASRGSTALGDALGELARSAGREPDGVVVVSDGVVNAGEDPVAAARALGVPVHALVVGTAGGRDRAVIDVESSTSARVGEATPVRVRVTSDEPRGAVLAVQLLDGERTLGRTTVVAPGSGAEATAEFRVVPVQPGLAVWTAMVDSAAGEISAANNAREVAVEVAPGRLEVLFVSAGLNWDLSFLRRALLGDSSLAISTKVRERGGWRAVESSRLVAAPDAADLRGQAVVVLDGLSAAEVGPEFDQALAAFVRSGGGLLLLGGSTPGILRYGKGRLTADLTFVTEPQGGPRTGTPLPLPEARELLAWDDDPARGERAWRAAGPLSEVAPVRPGPGDRAFIASVEHGPPLLLARRVGRGQALLVNGAGLWRWSLSNQDDLGNERGRRLWRRIVRWLAEPVQGEPLRVRPERWLSPRGETVRLFASLQDEQFRPVAGATLEAEIQGRGGPSSRVGFTPRAAGSYEAALSDLKPGRYRVRVRAVRAGRELGQAMSEFAVDRWSLEEARTEPDSAALSAVAAATGGRITQVSQVARWARSLATRSIGRAPTRSIRLWESPWVFAALVGALSLEWAWRRRRGLP